MRRLMINLLMVAAVLLWGAAAGFGQEPASTQIFGGQGGREFSDFQPPSGARVIEVRIRFGDRIDSVQMVYALPDGRTVAGPRHGGEGGRLSVFQLGNDEYIIGLSGRFGENVDSLRIHTSRRTSPLYGGGGGDRNYRLDVPSGAQAIGFAGRAGEFLDAIGLTYNLPGRRRGNFPSNPVPEPPSRLAQTRVEGGRGGSPFVDPEVPSGARIAEVRIQARERVDSVQMVYVLPNGRVLDGPRHGGGGGNLRTFRLDPDEYIIAISGRCGEGIDSLRIHTNKRTSQVFGGLGGDREYRLEVPQRSQAIGFVGRAGEFLDAIGLAYASQMNRR